MSNFSVFQIKHEKHFKVLPSTLEISLILNLKLFETSAIKFLSSSCFVFANDVSILTESIRNPNCIFSGWMENPSLSNKFNAVQTASLHSENVSP